MKKLRGSSKYLAEHLMKEVQVQTTSDVFGKQKPIFKRHDMKMMAKAALEAENKVANSSNMARLMPVYSFATNSRYTAVWRQFFDHTKTCFRVNDIDKIKRSHIDAFMRDLIAKKVKLSTYKTYSAALSKLEVAMNVTRKEPLLYSELLKKIKAEAVEKLSNKSISRSYEDPSAVISTISNERYQMAANLQLHGGARLREITELRLDRNFQGIKGNHGFIKLTNTKGGRIRTMRIPAELYRQVEAIAIAEGRFKVSEAGYTKALQRAFDRAVIEWHGSHGLRWNYAQNRFYELQKYEDKTEKEALQIVSFELGHSRPGITTHYLR